MRDDAYVHTPFRLRWRASPSTVWIGPHEQWASLCERLVSLLLTGTPATTATTRDVVHYAREWAKHHPGGDGGGVTSAYICHEDDESFDILIDPSSPSL